MKTEMKTIGHYEDWYKRLKMQFVEMSQLKSDFDIEKFTIMSQGDFVAHQFHFLMRQYSLTLGELRRVSLDKEEAVRNISKIEKDGVEDGYADIEILREKNKIEGLDLQIANKLASCNHFEELRVYLIDKNGGEITNTQYQAEEPEYWKWKLIKLAVEQRKQAETGISEGVWRNIHYLEEAAPLTEEYQIDVLDNETGRLDFQKAQLYLNEQMKRSERIKQIAGEIDA